MRKLSHECATSNFRIGAVNPAVWAQLASENLEHLSRSDEHRLMHGAKGGKGAGLAIVFGNILDTIPGSLVIGAKFAGFTNRAIFLLWSTVLAAGVVAAVAGKMFISNSESAAAVLAQAVAAAPSSRW